MSISYWVSCGSVQFSRSVVSDSLRPHESQHSRPPCPSPSPGVHSDYTSIESMMPSSHLILGCPLLLLPPNPSQHQSLFCVFQGIGPFHLNCHIYVIMFPYYPFDSHKVLSDIPCFIPAIFHLLWFFFSFVYLAGYLSILLVF